MALIVEDGSVVVGANSYTSLVNARDFLLSVGYQLNIDDAIAEQQLIMGFAYVNSFENLYQGCRISAIQEGSFPRVGVSLNGFPVDSDAIPSQIIKAQCLSASEENQESGSLFPSGSQQTITSEEVVGAIKVSYSDNGISSNNKSFAYINSLLNGLFKNSAGINRVFRV